MDNSIYINNISLISLISLILIFLFYVLDYLLYLNVVNIRENFIVTNDDINIIIARYNEDLKWTLDKPFNKYKYIVYNKGDNENFEKSNIKEIIKLPNVGKCDHTYLYHIINNYDNLKDITVFFPGSIDLKYKKRVASEMLREIELNKKAIFISLNKNNISKLYYDFQLDYYKTKHKGNKSKNPESELKKSKIRPFGAWFENMFGNIEINCLIYYGIFSIHKNDIIQHPKSYYEKLIEELSYDSNPEVGHYFERSWCAIFHPLKETYIIKYKKI